MNNMNKNILFIVLLVVIGAGGFFAGTKYQQNKTASQFGQFRGRMGQNAGRNGARPVAGEIVSANDTSITVKLSDGSSKIVLLSNATNISKASVGSKSDLTTGTKVAVFGTENSDGSVSAMNIQINTTNILGARTPNQKQKSPDAREIVVTESNYSFIPSSISVKKGEKVRVVVKNSDGTHDFKIEGMDVSTAIVQSGQEDFVEFTADKTGSFKFYCSVGNHRAQGMEGTLIVE